MSDHFDELIGGALDEFRHAEALEGAPVGGSAAVRARVARRRMAGITTYSVLGALLIAIPFAAFAANPRGNNGPPSPDGRFSAEELVGAPAPAVAASRCGESYVDGGVYVKEVAHANLDSDPSLETAALLVCTFDQSTRVMAYDRGPNGKPVSAGVIVDWPGQNDVIGIRTRDAGGITATVQFGRGEPTVGDPPPQLRDFAWDGSRIVQVGGPTAFVKAKAALSLTATPLPLGPAQDGKRSGEVTLTLHNAGPEDSLPVDIELSTSYRITVAGFPGTVASVKAGESISFRVTVTIEVEPGQTPLGFGAGLYSYADDPNVADNSVQIEVVP